IQPAGAEGITGTVEVFDRFAEGLKDLDGFSHVILIYHLHRSSGFKLLTVPFMDTVKRGVFATRAPHRPNPIGLSVINLIKIEGAVLHVRNIDILDGTPLLDIKPYVPDFDHHQVARFGWLEQARGRVRKERSDNRFKQEASD
ncbi:MAG TPA: tRNA (N6-threonylcarbamoyladenosine(37)-N6)-methyltransferase TrmO, partial [Candidatus Acetothermia bacterium]|nr:tRNA (N6-threonylcarbamoyladenosine(37)-N6)-methyltransferase TrmO [Candidatus Acetothermia bacterium]